MCLSVPMNDHQASVLERSRCDFTFGNDKLQVSGQPPSLDRPGAPVGALVHRVHLFQSGRLVHAGVGGRRGRREGSGEFAGCRFQSLPGRARRDQARREHAGQGGCRAQGSIHSGVVFGRLDDTCEMVQPLGLGLGLALLVQDPPSNPHLSQSESQKLSPLGPCSPPHRSRSPLGWRTLFP